MFSTRIGHKNTAVFKSVLIVNRLDSFQFFFEEIILRRHIILSSFLLFTGFVTVAGGCRFVEVSPGINNAYTAPKKRAPSNDPARIADIKGAVVHISDGDTFIVESAGGERTTIRIHAIDAPELSQDFGKESREQLRALIANQTVTVRKHNTDQYRRIVGSVFLNEKDIGLEMIGGGYAWHFKQYQKQQSAEEQKAYTAAENAARESRLGIWRDSNPTAPWDYRRLNQNRR
jgi:endonuclease YncB( thermonuclease family)